MSEFYARYVPHRASQPKPTPKRPAEDETNGESDKKKRKIERNSHGMKIKHSEAEKYKRPSDEDTISKYRVTSAAKKTGDAASLRHRKSNGEISESVAEDQSENKEAPTKEFSKVNKSKKQKEARLGEEMATKTEQTGPSAGSTQDDPKDNHVGVWSKFRKSQANQKAVNANKDKEDGADDLSQDKTREPTELIELHGLEPLPQPADVDIQFEQPDYSTLPSWLAKPLRIQPKKTKLFESLGLSKEMVEKLQGKGFDEALPLQTGVIPLLLRGKELHKGDLSISAATGSGKTLTYVVPVVESLQQMTGPKLRAVVVVPTRELVDQVREVFELCVSGTRLRIATAVGSRPMKEEQELLIEKSEQYDPGEATKRREAPIDWNMVDVMDLIGSTSTDITVGHSNFVTKYSSKVDILICTPGRLIDHLESTKGFNLDHVQWVVVDEADRVLSESYHDWVGQVIPALKSTAATELQNNQLLRLHMDVIPRNVRKIMFSATMTKNLSKLDSLALWNPKMVVLESEASQESKSSGVEVVEPIDFGLNDYGTLSLPATLLETAIHVSDGSEKPLYLLKLLRSEVFSQPKIDGLKEPASSHPSASRLDESSSGSSDGSPSSDSDSESESTSSTASRTHSPAVPAIPATSKSGIRRTQLPSSSESLSSTALIFTRSSAAAHRLSRLLTLLVPSLAPQISTLTKLSSSKANRQLLKQFRAGQTSVIIATDRLSRGLDLPHLGHVINYDVPSSTIAYVHRVGRTARAGRPGQAWTLVEHREGRWFWGHIGGKSELRKAGDDAVDIHRKGKVAKMAHFDILDGEDESSPAGAAAHEDLRQRYEKALAQLGHEVYSTLGGTETTGSAKARQRNAQNRGS